MNSSASQSIRVGIFFLIGVALVWIVWETLGDNRFSRHQGYQVTAPFSDLRQLKINDDVRMAGVRIGTVIDTRLEGAIAVAVLSIDEQYRIPGDSQATITTAGLLGSNYIAIQPGSSDQLLQPNARIETVITPDLNDVIAELGKLGDKVEEIFAGFGGEGGLLGDNGDLFANLNAMIEENRHNIAATMENFNRISTDIAEGKGTLGKLISDDQAYETLLAAATDVRDAARQISTFANDARTIVDDVKSGKGPAGVLLYDEEAGQQLRTTIANVQTFSARLNDENNTLGRILADDALYVRAVEALDKVDTALGSLDDSGPITAVGVVAGALF